MNAKIKWKPSLHTHIDYNFHSTNIRKTCQINLFNQNRLRIPTNII